MREKNWAHLKLTISSLRNFHWGNCWVVHQIQLAENCKAPVWSEIRYNLRYATGRERKDDGKPCVTSWNRYFRKRPGKTLKLGDDHDKTRKYLPRHVCHAQAFCLPVYPAVLLRKLTNNYKTFLVSRKVYKHIKIRVYKVNMSSNRHTYMELLLQGYNAGMLKKVKNCHR